MISLQVYPLMGQIGTVDLSKALVTECSQYSNYNSETCGSSNTDLIGKKFIEATAFLREKLKSLYLADTSTYYKEQKVVLEQIEAEREDSPTIDDNLKLKLENQYLLLSLLRVLNSRKYYDELIKLYLNDGELISTCNNGEYPSEQNCVLSESFEYYKIWLHTLLIERFEDKRTDYEEIQATAIYNWIVAFTNQPSAGNLEKEKEILEKLNYWAPKSMIEGHVRLYFKDLNELLAAMYRARASKIQKSEQDFDTHEMFSHIEQLLFDSYALSKDYMTKYSIGVHYHNYAIHLETLVENGLKQKGLNNIQDMIEYYREESASIIEEVREEYEKEKN
jgi:hypothetical protein